MRTNENYDRKYPDRITFVTSAKMVEQIREASARLMTSRNAWLRAAALEKLERETA
jgi:hypothetical protein